MGVYTAYDEKRDELRETLSECLEKARNLLDENIDGYEEMNEGYALNLYQIVRKARETV